MDFGLLAALLGGILTLLSPCSVMLLPAFFSYAFTTPRELLTRTGIFYLGLCTTLVPLGLLAGTVGAFVTEHRMTFVVVASIVVILLGLIMLLGIRLPFLSPTHRVSGTSTASVYALGTVYGLAGVCAGPMLGAVLTVAALGGNALYGGLILLVFAAGMTIPLLALALVWGKLPFVQRLLRPRELQIGRWRNSWISIISGALTIGVGVLLLVSSGTASFGGVLGASEQLQLESWVMRSTGGVADAVVIVIVAAGTVAAGIVVYLSRRRRAIRLADAQRDQEPSVG